MERAGFSSPASWWHCGVSIRYLGKGLKTSRAKNAGLGGLLFKNANAGLLSVIPPTTPFSQATHGYPRRRPRIRKA
jgi:hypothetical protein